MDSNLEGVTVQATAFMTLGNVRQAVRRFEGKLFENFHNQALHSVRSSLGNASEADMVNRLSGREMMAPQEFVALV